VIKLKLKVGMTPYKNLPTKMLDISITNIVSAPVADDDITSFAKSVFGELSVANFELSIVIVGAEQMETWNTLYKHHSGSTDVLSFPLESEDKKNKAGEVVLNWTDIKSLAAGQDREPIAALKYLLIHGILHLSGYNHEGVSEQQAREMMAKQSELTKKFDVDF